MAIRKIKFYTFLSIFILTMFLIPSFLTNAMLGGTNSFTKVTSSSTFNIDSDGHIIEGSRAIYEVFLQEGWSITVGANYYMPICFSRVSSSDLVSGFTFPSFDVVGGGSPIVYTALQDCYCYCVRNNWTISSPQIPEPSPEVSPSPEPSPDVSPSPSPVPDVPDVPSYIPNTYLLIIIFLLGVIAVCNLFRK